MLEDLRSVKATLVLYEAPSRIGAALADAADVLGPDRRAVLCRELTKRFEECRSGTLRSLAESIDAEGAKGELVIVIDRPGNEAADEDTIETALAEALQTMTLRDAADVVSAQFGLPRRDVYKRGLNLKGQ
jgi:16S rRNA (cytidine1402-2'-O)-methyltransferase